MAVLKRLAARTQPCRTPDEMVNGSVRLPFTRTILFVEVYSIYCDDVNDFLWCTVSTDYF